MKAICHICELPIPLSVVSPKHPLFGTIDHVIPRARGGADTDDNRMPAHRYCNCRKGADALTPELKRHCLYAIRALVLADRKWMTRRMREGIAAAA